MKKVMIPLVVVIGSFLVVATSSCFKLKMPAEPSVELLSPGEGEVIEAKEWDEPATEVTFKWKVTDPNGGDINYAFYLDGVQKAADTATSGVVIEKDISIAKGGTHTWYVEVDDGHLKASETSNFRYNRPPKEPELLEPLEDKEVVEGESVPFKWRIEDRDGDELMSELYINGDMKYSTNTVAETAKEVSWDFEVSESGTYTWYVKVSDGVDEVISTKTTINITLNSTP